MVTVLRPLTSLQFQIHHEEMKSIFALIFLFGGSIFQAQASQNKFNIKVLSSNGTISDLSHSENIVAWNRKSKVADRLTLSLKEGAETKIQLNPKVVLTAYENTEFEIPLITWETRIFKEIKLTKGSVRLEIVEVPFEIEVITPFFKVNPPIGNWVFNIDPERALADILALKGSLEVASLNSDDKVKLKTGEKATFRGLLEEGEISYDLLLEGRKIPKGKWTAVESIDANDNQKYSIESEKKRLEREQKQKSKANDVELRKQAGDLCLKPKAMLGECIWRKEKTDCVRTRCAADGKWKDPQRVSPVFCDKKAGWTNNPKKCDY